MISVCTISIEGAPSLRFLQGRVSVLPTQLLSACTKPVAYAFAVPALRKEREGRGTHCVADASEIKSLGHPPVAGHVACRVVAVAGELIVSAR
jgi:hypothetical protein